MQPTLPPPLNSHVAVWFLITNTSAQYFLSNWKVFFHIYYSLYLIIFMFKAIFTWLMEKLTTEKSVLLYVEDKERVFKKVKEHKRSSKLKDNSYSNLPIGCSSSTIYVQPLNLVSVFQFLLKSNFSWSTFCLSISTQVTQQAEYLVETKFSCKNILNLPYDVYCVVQN